MNYYKIVPKEGTYKFTVIEKIGISYPSAVYQLSKKPEANATEGGCKLVCRL